MLKRLLDIFVAAIALLLLSPLLLLVSLLIAVKMKRPVIFSQLRPGLHSKAFTMFKFRTMSDETSAKGVLLADEDRLLTLGKWLRATSIDELPGLFNVLLGQMSLIGPRPLLVEYLPLYSPDQRRRHEMRPGITGWAQVNGRNAISWEQKFEYDLWYVDNQSFWLDMKIVWMTLGKVLSRADISHSGEATMARFTGSKIKKPKKNLLIIGAGGHGKVVADCAEVMEQYDNIAFLDNHFPDNQQVCQWQIVGTPQEFESHLAANTDFFVAIGDNQIRHNISEQIKTANGALARLIHPSAVVSQYAKIGEGSLICANAVINIASHIGIGCIVNTGAIVDHDCVLGDYVHIAPGARLAGHISLGDFCLVGVGAVIIPGLVLGQDSILGAGSTLIVNLPKASVAVGCPAVVINKKRSK
jgi:sugar O-acyltransferase (sialic acid O-acetyltransferase NeuD family)